MSERVVCCDECDELCRIRHVEKSGRFLCPNCGHTLLRHTPEMIEKMTALSIAAFILFILTLFFPFLSFHVFHHTSQTNFITGISYLFKEHEWLLGVAVLMTTVVVPLQRIVLFLLLFIPLFFKKVPAYASFVQKALSYSTPWGMLDVYLVGVLVSLVKLLKMGDVMLGTSIWAFGALVFVLAAMEVSYHPYHVWEIIDASRNKR